MKVAEAMVRNVFSVSPRDSVPRALALMSEHRVHQLPVVDDDLFVGMVSLKDILGSKAAIVDAVMVKTPVLGESDTLETAIAKLHEAGLRALPIVDNNEVRGIISETDLIRHIKILKEIGPEHFASKVAIVNEDDGVNKAISIMREANISRVIVVGGEKVRGGVDTLSLAEFLSKPGNSVRSSAYTAIEKESLANFKVKDFMRQTCVMDRGKFSLKEGIRCLQEHEEIVVTDRNEVFGIITPKDVLELSDYEELPLQVAHADVVPRLDAARINDRLTEFVKKLQKMAEIQKMLVYFDAISQNGRVYYFVRSRLLTGHNVFIAKGDAWNIDAAVQDMIGNMERQFLKLHEKRIKGRRAAYRKNKEK